MERKLQTTFNHNQEEIIEQEAKVVLFSAGHTVLWEGDTASYLYYIIQGVVRGYYIDSKGNDITKCFCAEEDFFSTEGYRISSPATFTIECLEDCKCLQLPYKSLKSIVNSNKSIGDLVSHLFQVEVSKLEDRSKSLMLLNAEERYRAFYNDYPHLHNRIALKYIASYIGVRAASLSRIRKKQKLDKN
ncbi:Crp/Fnr family transcriptional regulator [Lacrimispora sp.]|uniref:Crp/Fnr family transcriptional regulator n=1 Tax=Lacrimispora sp. TaxID=2719234 RepID=UPI0028AB8B48|nr:Crp/Fnr family transcriptional regulator [Lacrimispora sp.]